MNIEKISKYLLTGLMAVSIIIFVLFFVVGFNNPYEENSKMNDPKMLDLLAIWMFVLVIVSAVSMLVSFVLYIMQHGLDKSIIYTWGLPIVGIAAGLAVGFTMKDDHMIINGKDWCIPSESIITDTSIVAIGVLAIVAIGVTVWSMIAEAATKD